MSGGVPLVVPVQCDALSVNASLLARDGFRWWRYDYSALDEFSSPEPVAQQNEITGGGAGVYLHWVLPAALRSGVQDPATGAFSYPKVPNRWLLARFHSSPEIAATAWVIESDCPYSPASKQAGANLAQTSMYLVDPALAQMWAQSPDPCRSTVQLPAAGRTPYANIGVAFPLASWKERDPNSTFLTALAPGNPAFPIYTPHNRGVFCFYDDMESVPVDVGSVSYAIVGWYSDPEDDPLAGWPSNRTSQTPFADALSALAWAFDGGPEDATTLSIYQGFALGVSFDPDGQPASGEQDPLAALKHSPDLDVAVGNTTIDAFTSLLAARNSKLGAAGAQVLRAFQYDLLPQLNEVNGEALLERSVRDAWHASSAGGYRWEIVAAASQDADAAVLTEGEQAWLAQLNADQEALDLALGELYALQWRFHELWWKRGRWPIDSFPEPPPGVSSQQELASQLDPAFVDAHGQGSVAGGLLDQLATVRQAATKVPQPQAGTADPQAALSAGIAAFATARSLDPGKVLKAIEAPRYWMPNDPVVVLSGVQPPTESSPGQTLQLRSASRLVTSLAVAGAVASLDALASLTAALPSSAALSGPVMAALWEWLLLDPANAAAIAAAIGKSSAEAQAAIQSYAAPAYESPLPQLGLQVWVQPWQPMYLEWAVAYAPASAIGSDGKSQWSFDGDDYVYAPTVSSGGKPQRLSGISLLSPHAQLVLGSQLQRFIAQYGGSAELEQVYEQTFGDNAQLPVLAQGLTGLNAQLSVRDQRALRRPDPAEQTPSGKGEKTYSVAELAGYPDADSEGQLPARYRGAVTSVPFMVAGVSPPFTPVREGQMWFTYLAVYDKFGRVLTVVQDESSESGLHDAASFPAVVDGAMLPQTKIDANIASVVELPPRILQPARLDFDLCDAADPSKLLWRDVGANPICGWLLPNHLDHSVLLFGSGGVALGELRLVVGPDSALSTHWDPPPHSEVRSLADLAAVAPSVAALVGAPALARASAFDALLEVIDTTLWSTDPLGARRDQALSVLIGRPLALVRANLRLSLQGPPRRDASWAGTFAPVSDAVLAQRFPVRLGDLATRDDGLIGYFLDEEWETLNTVAAPQERSAQTYVRPIGATLTNGEHNYIGLTPNVTSTVTMLLDPCAGVHASSGAVPVVRTALPGPLVSAALKALEVTFRIEPALTYVQPTPVPAEGPAPSPASSIVLPVPSERAGAWTFWDREPEWTSYGLIDATANAELKPYSTTLRDGLLQLLIDLDEKTPSQ